MKKSLLLVGGIILITTVFTSCRSTKNIRMMQNLSNGDVISSKFEPPLYRIKADDNLYISVQSTNPELDKLFNLEKTSGYSSGTQQNYGDVTSQYINGYQVSKAGTIILPMLGTIQVLDKTEEEIQSIVQKKVDEYFAEATVKVKLLTFKFSVLGEVRNPGSYRNYNKTLTVLEAISMASGTSDVATIKKVLVVRTLDNVVKSYRLDLTDKESIKSEAFFLVPNDVVYVEPDKYKNFAINSTSFSIFLSAITTTVLLLSYLKI